MEAKIKPPKNPKASNKTHEKSKQETPRKFHAEILSLNHEIKALEIECFCLFINHTI